MNTHDKYELPPLPSPFGIVDPDGTEGLMQYTNRDLQDYAKSYARTAIEADRQRQANWHRIADDRAAEIVRLEGELDRKHRGEPVGYVMPTAIKQLKAGGNAIVGGVSQGGDVAVYLAPQPSEPTKTNALCQECGGDGAGGEHEDDCSQGEPVLDRADLVADALSAPQPDEPIAMSLDDAIAHAVAIAADGSTPCRRQHLQLAAWLRELRELRCAAPQPAEPVSTHPDDAAVDVFAAEMKAKLAKKRADGRAGWQECTSEYLSGLLREHVEKGDPVDVANLAMMLSQNGQRIEATEPVKVPSREEVVDLWEQAMRETSSGLDAMEYFARDLLARYGQQSFPAAAIAYVTRNEEGDRAMLFFELAEARLYCNPDEEPEALVLAGSALQAQPADPDAERYRKFVGAGLPITYLGEDYRDKSGLDAAIDATPTPAGTRPQGASNA